jgi:predicted amidophosphoribosyltransferase
MICKNCKAEILETAIYCPHCGFKTLPEQEEIANEKKEKLSPADLWGKLGLLIGALSIIISIMPFNQVLIISGICLGFGALLLAIFQSIKKKHKLSTLTIIIAVIGFVSNLSWLLFITYVL